MANIVNSRTVRCPDYGEIEILIRIPKDQFIKFLKSKNDPLGGFANLIKSISCSSAIEIEKLTDADLEIIAIEIANNYGLDELYKARRKTFSRELTLQMTLKEHSSSFLLKIERSLEHDPSMRKMAETLNLASKIMKFPGIFGQVDNIKALQKSCEGSFTEIAKSFGGIEKLKGLIEAQALISENAKLVPTISALQKAHSGIAKEIAGIAAASSFAAASPIFDYVKAQNSKLEELKKSFEYATSFNKKVAESFVLLGQALPRWDLSSIKLSNELVLASRRLVLGANSYFSKSYEGIDLQKITYIPKELAKRSHHVWTEAERSESQLEADADRSILLSNTVVLGLRDDIEDIRENLRKFAPLLNRMAFLSEPKNFINCLQDFSAAIQESFHKVFWNEENGRLIPHPEKSAQSHLGIFLKAKFEGIAFVGREISAGNGYIDLLVHFMGRKYIVEIKIVGNGWSIGGAEDGLPQLDTYMQTYETSESYLVIMDGRKTDRGKKLNDSYQLKNGTVRIINVKIFWPKASR